MIPINRSEWFSPSWEERPSTVVWLFLGRHRWHTSIRGDKSKSNIIAFLWAIRHTLVGSSFEILPDITHSYGMTTSPIPTLFSVANKNVLITGGSRGIGLMVRESRIERHNVVVPGYWHPTWWCVKWSQRTLRWYQEWRWCCFYSLDRASETTIGCII